jgi:hypothetical protein
MQEEKQTKIHFSWRGALWGFLAYLIVAAIVALVYIIK